MNGSCQSPEPVLCGCCEGIGPETPQPIANRQALSAVAYRTGTWASFKASMLALLSDTANAAPRGLRTRDDSDFSIALIDAWAVAADIVSFYQERVANESWLRTAVDQRSVFELARLVGYRPSPGVAASAFLSFTLSNAPGSPDNVPIPAGTRVQSVPGPGQSPQMFETSQDLTAQIGWNAIPAQATVPWSLSAGDTQTAIAGTSHNLNPGDALLFVNGGAADFHFVTSAITNADTNTTTLNWDGPLADGIGQNNAGAFVYVLRKKAALFGVQAPDPRFFPDNSALHLASDWDFKYDGSLQVSLDASYAGLTPASGGQPSWVVFSCPALISLFQIAATAETGPLAYTLTSKTTRLTVAGGLVLYNNDLASAIQDFVAAYVAYGTALATGNGIAQAIADLWAAVAEYQRALQPLSPDDMLSITVRKTRSATVYAQSQLLPNADPPFIGPWTYDGTLARQSGLLKPVEGVTLEIAGGQTLSAGRPVGVSGKRLRLRVASGSGAGFVPDGSSGSLAVDDGQVFIVEAFPPATLGANTVWQATTLSGITGALTVAAQLVTLLPADAKDPVAAESAVLTGASVAGAVTTLTFGQALSRIYDRATVSVNANTVAATNGETVHEILGSGDATNPALQFALKQNPLTYVSSSSALGAQSTLQVWVNNLQWHETGNFLSSAPSDRVFVTRPTPGGGATVQFGDGAEGARTPTGQMNIRAVYRKGIGAGGNVSAGQISQPLDRPQGVKGATNASAATGGADPDTAEDARASAPLHTLTLGRVVSLEDYQNFARAFAGIAKALATWTWFGGARSVFLTVAGADGGQFNASDPTLVHLTDALRRSGNPFVPLQVASFTPVLFEVGANVFVDGVNYDPTETLGRVWQALSAAFAFSARNLGQGVAQSEVVEIIQNTAGVVAVELTNFNRSGQAIRPLPAVLRAASPITGGNVIPQHAEMLLLDPASRGNIGARS